MTPEEHAKLDLQIHLALVVPPEKHWAVIHRGDVSRLVDPIPLYSRSPALIKQSLWKTGLYVEIQSRWYLSANQQQELVMIELKRKDWSFEGGAFFRIERLEGDTDAVEATALCRAALEAIEYQAEKVRLEKLIQENAK